MGLFSKKQTIDTSEQEVRALRQELIKMVIGYTPAFSTYAGGLYEMDLTVSAIDSMARHASKASIKIKGSAYKNLGNQWKIRINDTMTFQQFIYRTMTIFKCENNVFLIPIYDDVHKICGLHPVSSIGSSIVKVGDELMLRYVMNSITYAIPYSEVGHVKSHQYKHELYGEGNRSLIPTLQLLDTQKQGILNGIKNSGIISFLGRIAQTSRPEEVAKLQKQFNEQNLAVENNGGIGLYDAKISEVTQVKYNQWTIDATQAAHIETSVFNYIGTNSKIMQNDFNEETWGSLYEGGLEPFLIQLGQVMTCILFTPKEIAMGNEVIIESTRLQHASTEVKWKMVTEGVDRGIFTPNEGRELMNLPPVDGGDKRMIRLEYTDVANLGKIQVGKNQNKIIDVEDDPKESEDVNDDNSKDKGV